MNFLLITYALKFILFYFKEKKNDGFFQEGGKINFTLRISIRILILSQPVHWF